LIESHRSVAVIGTQKASGRDLAASLQLQPRLTSRRRDLRVWAMTGRSTWSHAPPGRRNRAR